MLTRFLVPLALLTGFAGLTSCSSGGSADGAQALIACDGAEINRVCLTACNLGCSQSGCQITDIAQNQPLSFSFSQPIDPASVNEASVTIVTAQGEPALGVRRVVGERIEFIPEIQVVAGTSFFGFKASATYLLTLQGGGSNLNAIRGTSGDPLNESITCTLSVTRGIIDLNAVAPSARLLEPTSPQNVSINSAVRLEFNEIVDASPFTGTTASNGPVRISMRRTRAAQGGGRECIATGDSVDVLGTQRISIDAQRNVSVWTFVPATPFPGEVCAEIEVTSAVRDLSGRPAGNQVFQFITESTQPIVLTTVENFDDDSRLDRGASAGSWANGEARFGQLGGSGKLGVFDITNGVSLGGNVYLWNTDSTVIPGAQTATGSNITVTDGVFEFSDFVVPLGFTLRFTGSNPVVVRSTGRIDVQGTIDCAGSSPGGGFNGSLGVIIRSGADGGPGAGPGGDGGLAGNGQSHVAGNNGRRGSDVQVASGHAFATQTGNTGGAGARQFPTDGRNASLVFVNFLTQMVGAGGGGGGYLTPGAIGEATVNNNGLSNGGPTNTAWLGPSANGGSAFDVTGPLAPPAGTASLDHFLIGGSGGGGGGSHALFTNSFLPSWYNGSGGGGGGGAIALRAGDQLIIGPTASVLATGGKGDDYIRPSGAPTVNMPTPGGGGSGGSILLQSGRVVDVAGVVDVSGGAGGILDLRGSTYGAGTNGGDGSDGYLRLEFPSGAAADPSTVLANAMPTAAPINLGDLTDEDQETSFTSLWYFTGQVFGPVYLRYEIEARVDGVSVLYSDDPAVSPNIAARGMAPIFAQWQGAQLDPATIQPQFGVDRPFRDYVGRATNPAGLTLADDALNGFRFKLNLDRSFGQEVIVDKVTVYYQF